MKASLECACTALCFLYLGRLVASQYAPVQHRNSTILIIGSAGHGKSTALNAMADEKKAFRVCGGKSVCTKEVTSKVFTRDIIGNDGKDYLIKVTLVDTPGFPDPSGNVATHDAVIDALQQPLNAVVWVVKPESPSSGVTEQDRALLDELKQLRVPIFQLVNGRKHYPDAAERKKRLRIDKADMLVIGDEMAKAAGLSIKGRFLSTTKPDLKPETQAIIYRSLSYPSLTSSLRSMEDIEESRGEQVKHQRKDEL